MEILYSISNLGNFLTQYSPWVYIITCIFYCINIFIIRSDLINKKIPNALLLMLIGIMPLYVLIYSPYITWNPLAWGVNICVAVLIGFGTYALHGWAPGDGKYAIVLAGFLPSGAVVSFFGNTAALALAGLIGGIVYRVIRHRNEGRVPKTPIPQERLLGSYQKLYKKSKGQFFLECAFALIQIAGSFLLVIYFREYVLKHIQPGSHEWLTVSIILFVGYIFLRQLQLYATIFAKRYSKKYGRYIVLGCFGFIIAIGYFFQQERFMFYIDDIVHYGIPTVLVVTIVTQFFLQGLRKTEIKRTRYTDLKDENIPVYLIWKGNPYPVKSREDIESKKEQLGFEDDEISIYISKTYPFGHALFLGFFTTTFININLPYEIMHRWFLLLEKIWLMLP